jgi:hypothetical protein
MFHGGESKLCAKVIESGLADIAGLQTHRPGLYSKCRKKNDDVAAMAGGIAVAKAWTRLGVTNCVIFQ